MYLKQREMVALLSPETLGERQRWRELGCGRLRRCGVAAFLCLVVLLDFCRCTSPNSPNCRPPCTNVICPSTPAPCVNGTYELCNGCCTACAAGLGQLCDSHGNLEPPCGDGLTCARGSRHYPGICERLPNASGELVNVCTQAHHHAPTGERFSVAAVV